MQYIKIIHNNFDNFLTYLNKNLIILLYLNNYNYYYIKVNKLQLKNLILKLHYDLYQLHFLKKNLFYHQNLNNDKYLLLNQRLDLSNLVNILNHFFEVKFLVEMLMLKILILDLLNHMDLLFFLMFLMEKDFFFLFLEYLIFLCYLYYFHLYSFLEKNFHILNLIKFPFFNFI